MKAPGLGQFQEPQRANKVVCFFAFLFQYVGFIFFASFHDSFWPWSVDGKPSAFSIKIMWMGLPSVSPRVLPRSSMFSMLSGGAGNKVSKCTSKCQHHDVVMSSFFCLMAPVAQSNLAAASTSQCSIRPWHVLRASSCCALQRRKPQSVTSCWPLSMEKPTTPGR